MKKSAVKINFKLHSSSVWLFFLILSVLSSCNIRKGIQASLEIPVTKQLNPSKAAGTSESACHYVSESENSLFLTSKTDSNAASALFQSSYFSKPGYYPVTAKVTAVSGWPLTLKVDSYILFRQIKSRIYS